MISPDKPEKNSQILFNAQKGILMRDKIKITAGLRSGTHLATHLEKIEFVNFNYLNSQLGIPGTFINVYLNAYYANHLYTGGGNNGGFMTGLAIPIFVDNFKIQGEYISGSAPWSKSTFGFSQKFKNDWEIELGLEIPNNPKNLYALTFQLSSPIKF